MLAEKAHPDFETLMASYQWGTWLLVGRNLCLLACLIVLAHALYAHCPGNEDAVLVAWEWNYYFLLEAGLAIVGLFAHWQGQRLKTNNPHWASDSLRELSATLEKQRHTVDLGNQKTEIPATQDFSQNR